MRQCIPFHISPTFCNPTERSGHKFGAKTKAIQVASSFHGARRGLSLHLGNSWITNWLNVKFFQRIYSGFINVIPKNIRNLFTLKTKNQFHIAPLMVKIQWTRTAGWDIRFWKIRAILFLITRTFSQNQWNSTNYPLTILTQEIQWNSQWNSLKSVSVLEKKNNRFSVKFHCYFENFTILSRNFTDF